MPPPLRTYRHSMPAPEDYFKGVSPMCRRILEEMSSVRESYGDGWKELTYDEQCKILDQAIVDEATVRRYELPASNFDCEYFPKLKISTGQKIISDEKLSARGYNCSWRDEHSAPFSWHTRSQMDLTLDTPPLTPTQSITSPLDNSKDPLSNPLQGSDDQNPKIKESSSNITIRQNLKTAPFLWHYEPNLDIKIPDPPDLVLATPPHSKRPSSEDPLIRRGSNFNHVVVTETNFARSSFYGWVRGAISFLTRSCLPIHSCATEKGPLLHPSSPFIHPELRPPHVIAKAAKVSLPTITQPKALPNANEKVLNKKKEEKPSSVEWTKKENANRRPDICGTIQNENLKSTDSKEGIHKQTTKPRLDNAANRQARDKENNRMDNGQRVEETKILRPQEQKAQHTRERSAEPEDELPLISLSSNAGDIPKTGFDFLDNW